MWQDLGLSLKEFVMHEPLPLSRIHQAVFEMLQGRTDAVVFGAQAVNVYVDEPRMTQDIDVLSPRAAELADEICAELNRMLHLAARVRAVAGGRGYCIYQVQPGGNRHLVDIRQCSELPKHQSMGGILVPVAEALLALKFLSWWRRQGHPKSGTDWRDLAMLTLAFPNLKKPHGAVEQCLKKAGADEGDLTAWADLCAGSFQTNTGDEDF